MPTIRKMTILSFMSSWNVHIHWRLLQTTLMTTFNDYSQQNVATLWNDKGGNVQTGYEAYSVHSQYVIPPPKQSCHWKCMCKKKNVYNKIANEVIIVALTTGKAWQNISEDLQLWPVVDASKPVASPWPKHTASLSKQNQCKGNNWSVEVNMYLCLQGLHEVGLLRCPQTTAEVKNRLKTSQVFFPPLQPVKSTACFRCEQHVSKPAVLSARTVS